MIVFFLNKKLKKACCIPGIRLGAVLKAQGCLHAPWSKAEAVRTFRNGTKRLNLSARSQAEFLKLNKLNKLIKLNKQQKQSKTGESGTLPGAEGD